MATQLNRKRDYEPPAIPDRLYFKIGDVARLCGVEAYVLRFWETQFPQLRPGKSGSGQRLYRRREVEMALEIKRLVHGEGYTLAGARAVLEEGQSRSGKRRQPTAVVALPASPKAEPDRMAAALDETRAALREIANLLDLPAQRTVRRRPRVTPISAFTGTLFPS